MSAFGPCLRYALIRLLDRIDDALGHPWYRACCWIANSSWWGEGDWR